MKRLTFENDPLLLERETLKDLIKNKQYPFLFLNKRDKVLNLFSAFVKKRDFIKTNKINQPFQKTVYVKVTKKLGNLINKKFYNKKKLQCSLEFYICRRTDLKKAIKRWFRNNIFPFVLIRVISEDNLEKFSQYTQEIEYFTDFLNKSRFYCPKTLGELLIPDIIYLTGCSAGDGHINKEEKRWALVEGTSHEKFLIFSKYFISNLAYLIKTFGCKCKIEEYETKYVLRVNSKLFCRFLNYFFDLPFGKKEFLTKPSILGLNCNLERYFWRGCFDTDGSVNFRGSVNLSSNCQSFLNECQNYLRDKGIYSELSKRRTELVLSLRHLKKFCYEVGFSHPRKQNELLRILKKDSKYYFAELKDNNSKMDPNLLRTLKLLRVDDNYRVRIHRKDLEKEGMKFAEVIKTLELVFDKKFKITPSLIYFKSKTAYNFLNDIFIYEPLNKKLTSEEELSIMGELNKIWRLK